MTTPQETDDLWSNLCRLRKNHQVWMKAQYIRGGDNEADSILDYGRSDRKEVSCLTRRLVVHGGFAGSCGDPVQLMMSVPCIHYYNCGEDQAEETQ